MQLKLLFLLAEYLQFVLLPCFAKEMTEDEAIAAHGGPLHSQAIWVFYLCLRLQVVGLRGESVVLSLLFFFLNFVGNSHLEGIL